MKLPKLTVRQSRLLAIPLSAILTFLFIYHSHPYSLNQFEMRMAELSLMFFIAMLGGYYLMTLKLFIVGRIAILLFGGEKDRSRAFQAALNFYVILIFGYAVSPILDLFL